MKIVLALVLLTSLACSAQTLISGRRRTLQAGGGPPAPAVGISYVGTATGTTSCTLPAHQSGDLLLAFEGIDGTSTAPTLATGWTNVTTASINGTSTADSAIRVSCKVATGSSETCTGFTTATSLVVNVYRNTKPATTATCASTALGTPSNFTSTINTTSTTVTYNSITNQDAASWDVGFAYTPAATAGLGTAPSGMTARGLQGSTKAASNDTNGAVSSFSTANVTVTTAGRVLTSTMEIKGPVAATPTLTPSSGAPPQTVTLASATTGANAYIHYTTTGVDPTGSDTTGTSVSVSTDPTTVKAKVISMPGWTDSAVGSGTYTSGGGGGIAEVGSGSQRATKSFSGDSTTQAFPANVTSGNLLVVVGSCWTSGTATSSITVSDTQGSYTVLSGVPTGSLIRMFVAYRMASSSAANTVTVNPNGASSDCGFAIDEFSGVNATPLDVDDGMTTIGNSGGAPSTSITTATANALVIGLMSYDDTPSSITPGSGYTQIGESETGVSSQPFNAEFKIVTTATAYTVDWTQGAATSNTGIYLVSFKP